MAALELSDLDQRRQAVDPELSCIVRAPAGSGKTELLIQRLLALLGRVERPDEILAITFTRKAAAEMRQRVLLALQQGQQFLDGNEGIVEEADHQRQTRQLACAVLERDRELGWHLLHHPDQLQIQTIDSFNAALIRRMPWLTRMGGLPQVSMMPNQLYREAVAEVIHLHHDTEGVNDAVRQLLIHLDNRADILEQLLMQLLSRRDQWLRHVLGDTGQQRQQLEKGLAHIVSGSLQKIRATLDPALQQELLVLGAFAAQHCPKPEKPLCALAQIESFPDASADQLHVWQGFADLLLTADGQWRKRCDKNGGFPAGTKEPFASMKKRMVALLQTLRDDGYSADLWSVVRALPAPQYSQQQWLILEALFTLLPQAVAQLWLVFSRKSEVDFVEIALKARQALVDSGNPTEQLLMLDHQVQHILIDEFQDTSWLQFDLLKTLISGWQIDEGRSLFVVGDPMQSIYRFREAEVGLFLQATANGVEDYPLQPLQLSANFRSQQGLVDWVNRWFPTILPQREDSGTGAVCYAHAQPVLPDAAGDAVQVFAQRGRDDEGEGEELCTLIQQLLQQSEDQSIAILVRSRPHLRCILAALRDAGIPYQAQNVDPLASRPVISDLVALVRALLHRADHLSWMTVLRAPWCGVRLADLIFFQGQNGLSMLEMISDDALLAQLSEDGQLRVRALREPLLHALEKRGRCPLREMIEETWLALQGPDCYSKAACRDVEQLFLLLDKLDCGGDLQSFEQLDEELDGLFSVNETLNDCRVQVMTIHKSKGLEFDHVILPGLGRRPRGEEKTLLRWQEHPECGLLLAPIAARGDSKDDPIYDLLGRVEQEKSTYEVARLLYVAVTRAKRHLYLSGHADFNQDDLPRPAKGSLLEKLWPAVESHFDEIEAVDYRPERGVQNLLHRLPEATVVARSEVLSGVQEALSRGELGQGVHVGQIPLAENRNAAIIGTITHSWLERLAKQGRDSVARDGIRMCSPSVAAQLRAQGLDELAIGDAVEHIIIMLERTLSSERGQWILASHEQAECELALTGYEQGELVNLIVDRTFVDQGVRWIIDYKTSKPLAQQSESAFYADQCQRYRQQLHQYILFLERYDPIHPCRCALYFPAFAGWCEMEDMVSRCRVGQGELF